MQLADTMFFTELVGLKVYDLKGRKLGRVRDAALVPLVDAVRVDRYLLGGGWAWLTVRHDQVERIDLTGLWLRDEQLTPYHRDDYMLRLGRDLLDQQIIDMHGRKVVRVTDVTLERTRQNGHEELRIQEVDVGLRSMFRRLMQGVIPRTWIRHAMQSIPPNSIDWKMCNIVESDPQRRLRLNISHQMLEGLHPADLADIVEDLSPQDREAIFETLDSEVAAEALTEIEPGIQASIVDSLDDETAADIIEEMSVDEAADLLSELEDEKSEAILEEMESEPKEEVQEMLELREDSAGRLMNTDFISLPIHGTVAEAIAAMKDNEEMLESQNQIFLFDGGEQYAGSVPLVRCLTANGDVLLSALRTDHNVSVPVKEKQKRVTELFDKYNLVSLAVVDDRKRLAGVITADDIIAVLRHK